MDNILLWILIAEIVVVLGLSVWLVLLCMGGKKKPAAQPAARPQSMDSAVVNGIARYAARFTGLYEALYMAAQGGSTAVPDAYREWQVRMEQLRGDSGFYIAFRGRFPEMGANISHVRQLLAHIHAAGVVRQQESVHVANAETKNRYIYLGDDGICPGRGYTVAKPCWMWGSNVIEQGVLVPGR